MTYAITIPNGYRVSLRAYAQAWRRAKALPPDLRITGWQDFSVTAADVVRDFTAGLHDRINQRGGIVVREHKRWHDWRRDQREITAYRLHRICCSGSGLRTPEARRVAPDVHAAFTDRETWA